MFNLHWAKLLKIQQLQTIEEAKSQEARSYRKRDHYTEPTLTRCTSFKVKDLHYHASFDRIDREYYWPEFIEQNDTVTFVAQPSLISLLPNRILAYVNHTKGTGIQNCNLGGWTTLTIGIFATFAIAHLVDEKQIGVLGYSLCIPTITAFCYRFMRYLQALHKVDEFHKLIREKYPKLSFLENEKIRKSFSHNKAKTYEGFPTINTVPTNSSQQRYLESFSSSAKNPAHHSHAPYQPVDSKYKNGAFNDLVALKDDHLWKIIVKNKTVAIVVVDKTFSFSSITHCIGVVIPNPGIEHSLIEQGQLIHSKSGSSKLVSDLVFSKDKDLYVAEWSYFEKQRQPKFTSNKERRRRKKRAK